MKKRNLTIIALVAISFVVGAFTSEKFFAAITADDVRKAGNIIGLEFSKTEIDSMLPGLEDLRKDIASNRQTSLENATSPALVFNPIPSDYEIPSVQKPMGFANPGKVKMPQNRDSLATMNVTQLAALIRTKQVTSEELTKFYIERLKKYGPKLNCVITLVEEEAMAMAKQADIDIKANKYKGVLHGIPYGAKDLLATKKHKTTWGAAPFKDQSFDYNATVIQKLEEAGAILIAKLSMGSLAMGDVWYGGQTKNPWDPTTGSSGSSAGSASAVAARLVPFAIGTETLGSIVSPSTVCGTVGLRPTFGRVSRYGAMALSWSMDKIGPITQTVEDAAVVFQIIHGPDGKDRSVIDAPFNYNSRASSVRGLKIGYLEEDFKKDYPFRKQDSLSLLTLRSLGYELVPLKLPEMPQIRQILFAEAAAAFDELTRSGQDDELVRQMRGAWPNLFRQARFIPAVEYIQANRLRTKLIEDMQDVFKEVDVYVHPSWASSSLQITNFTGHPCVVVPNGFQDNGRPTSISFTGKLFEEGKLLNVAKAYQDVTPYRFLMPDLEAKAEGDGK